MDVRHGAESLLTVTTLCSSSQLSSAEVNYDNSVLRLSALL